MTQSPVPGLGISVPVRNVKEPAPGAVASEEILLDEPLASAPFRRKSSPSRERREIVFIILTVDPALLLLMFPLPSVSRKPV